MLMPELPRDKSSVITKMSSLGDGENTFGTPFSIKESESYYSRNLSSDKYPALSVRQKRSSDIDAVPTAANALGSRNASVLISHGGGSVYKWEASAWASIGTLDTNAATKIVEFATGTTLYTVFANSDRVKSYDGTTLAELVEAPKTPLYVPHNFRLYAIDGKQLYFCAINDITDWTTANDAGVISITEAKGNGTAIRSFDNHVCIFTSGSFHELYGTDVTNFQLVDVSENGCLSDRCLVEMRGRGLFWLDYDGVYQYTGGIPRKISDKVQSYIEDINFEYKHLCCAGVSGEKVYFSIPYDGNTTNNLILCYDARHRTWYPQESTIVDFTTIGDTLYGLQSDRAVVEFDQGEDSDIEWSWESGYRDKDSIRQRKTLTSLFIQFDLPIQSVLHTYIDEGNGYVLKRTFHGTGNPQFIRVIMKTRNTDWYRLKFEGKGSCTIHSIEELFRLRGV